MVSIPQRHLSIMTAGMNLYIVVSACSCDNSDPWIWQVWVMTGKVKAGQCHYGLVTWPGYIFSCPVRRGNNGWFHTPDNWWNANSYKWGRQNSSSTYFSQVFVTLPPSFYMTKQVVTKIAFLNKAIEDSVLSLQHSLAFSYQTGLFCSESGGTFFFCILVS